MRAGLLRHRLVIQRAVETKDTLGGDVQTWATLATVWGQVRPLSGREAYESQRVTTTASHFMTIRYREDIAPQMRVVWHGRTFEITFIENTDGRDRALVLWVTEMQGLIGQVA